METSGGHVDDRNAYTHVSVLALEVLQALRCRPGGLYVDATVGQGGLAALILKATGSTGMVIGIDRDETALAMTRQRLSATSRLKLVHGNFADLQSHLRVVGLSGIDGIVFDLGVSSAQLNDPTRGMSFLSDGPLDMRMDPTDGITACELIQQSSEAELSDLIFRYGEERYARRIARAIVQERALHPLHTTAQLVSVIRRAVPASYRHGRIHVATRTFQAVRIAVNRELDSLESAFRAAAHVLNPGGRLCVISFHSLEDRIAKQVIRDLSQGDDPVLMRVTKKPVVPSAAEIAANPRARSAKLRIAERLPQRRCA